MNTTAGARLIGGMPTVNMNANSQQECQQAMHRISSSLYTAPRLPPMASISSINTTAGARLIGGMPTVNMNANSQHECQQSTGMPTVNMNANSQHECQQST
jgi:hypothetical protein